VRGRPEVPVHQTGVHCGERFGQGRREGADRVLGQRAVVGDRVGRRRPGHVRGGEPRHFGIGIGVHNRCRVRAGHPPRGVDFAAEPSPDTAVRGEFRPDDLQYHRPPAGRPDQIHLAHAARAQPGEKPVAAQTRRIAGPELWMHVSPVKIPSSDRRV
jgi:hypothetical protein